MFNRPIALVALNRTKLSMLAERCVSCTLVPFVVIRFFPNRVFEHRSALIYDPIVEQSTEAWVHAGLECTTHRATVFGIIWSNLALFGAIWS